MIKKNAFIFSFPSDERIQFTPEPEIAPPEITPILLLKSRILPTMLIY